MTRLWEVEHAYYCNQGNYYAPGHEQPTASYRTWAAFLESEGDSDFDYNLLFRWDWYEGGFGGCEFTGDENYRNGMLQLSWMGQRKGLYRWTEVEVCRADEPTIRAWLEPRFAHLLALWLPLSASVDGRPKGGDEGDTSAPFTTSAVTAKQADAQGDAA